jgi:hypothetical protein
MGKNKVGAILMGLATIMAPATIAVGSPAANESTTQTRDQRPQPRFLLNQKQYRKRCRHNASSYRSKKHRSKN